jgi:tyrosyl-tRNA synthetase
MLAGRTMQKAYGKREKFVLTVKLIEGTDGRKMSKTYENCVYLDDSPKDMFGKLLRIEDKLITTYFECCTDVPVHRYKEIEQLMKEGENPKIFKMELAKAIVAMYHGKREADHAAEEFERVFHSKEVPEDIPEVSVKKGTLLIDVIVDQKLAPSKSEARRLFDQGGVKLNDKVINAIDAKAEKGILKVGKRRFLKLC